MIKRSLNNVNQCIGNENQGFKITKEQKNSRRSIYISKDIKKNSKITINNIKSIRTAREKLTVVLSVLFVFWSLISLVFSPINLTDGLFGLPGRHTGVLTYFFLCSRPPLLIMYLFLLDKLDF
jgi:hypothetical protein